RISPANRTIEPTFRERRQGSLGEYIITGPANSRPPSGGGTHVAGLTVPRANRIVPLRASFVVPVRSTAVTRAVAPSVCISPIMSSSASPRSAGTRGRDRPMGGQQRRRKLRKYLGGVRALAAGRDAPAVGHQLRQAQVRPVMVEHEQAELARPLIVPVRRNA